MDCYGLIDLNLSQGAHSNQYTYRWATELLLFASAVLSLFPSIADSHLHFFHTTHQISLTQTFAAGSNNSFHLAAVIIGVHYFLPPPDLTFPTKPPLQNSLFTYM